MSNESKLNGIIPSWISYTSKLTEALKLFESSSFQKFIEEILLASQHDACIYLCGNGGSSATASHAVCDLNKGVSYNKKRRLKVHNLSDNIPTIMAYANDLSFEDIFIEQLKNLLKPKDLVIGISGSGNSKNIIKAIQYANKMGVTTFGICGMGGGKLLQVSQYCAVIPSDDMQKIEDIHSIILHCAMQILYNILD